MKKKIVALILVATVVLTALCALTACTEKDRVKIVYLGDSIAEAVLGPSPLSERDNYGYYALVGKRNNYEYINRSVSGHRTYQMLQLISQEDNSALLIKSHIMDADIIHISILGNDMLQTDVGGLIRSLYDYKTTGKEMTYVNQILYGDGTDPGSYRNIAAIVDKLKELNPDATIMFQTVYDPLYPGRSLFKKAQDALADVVDPETTDWTFYHDLGEELIDGYLNKVLYDYVRDNPDSGVILIEVNKEFEKIADERGTDAVSLIYPDGVHPSNEGHAVMADLIQAKLEELGLADAKSALKSYKNLRKDMLERLYPEQNTKDLRKAIDKAGSCSEVTSLYFRATDGVLPKYI